MSEISLIDSTLFKLVEIEEYEEVNHLNNMVDITVEDDESFTFADGIVSHNSALGMGINVRDPKKHGFYGLRGKVLNTQKTTDLEIMANKELAELISIIGLELSNESIDGLNYGNIAILTDADHDGNAIACLLFSFFSRWKGLFNGHIYRVVTPLYIARKANKQTQYFYTQDEYEKASHKLKGWDIDYIKGLGSLEKSDYAETIIKNPKMYKIELDDVKYLDVAFSKNIDKRKEWLLGEME